jgi:uncharacterized protein YdiU (UPF0061 family)
MTVDILSAGQYHKHMSHPFRFEHSYQSLGDAFFERRDPEPAKAPKIVLFNQHLAESLGLDVDGTSEEDWALYLSGSVPPPGSSPIAQAYAGHQFGGFTVLGDGRAILLGEHVSPEGQRFDVQLKGSGITRFSRRGDGRATLRAMLREYLISESIHHLGIPSTRSLAVTTTGLPVYREQVHQGAVLTRIAASHIRVGTFEYVKHMLDESALRQLVMYTLERHYPELPVGPNPGLTLLDAVMERQLDLIVHWMRVGFIHGVMNTDNMSMAGETIDYGPCAFMNAYRPGTVFSSIDTHGRYAYANQPRIAQWNLAVLAGTLLSLIDPNEDTAVKRAQLLLNSFPERYLDKWQRMMNDKLGLIDVLPEDRSLVDDLLSWMESRNADYTATFLALETTGKLAQIYPDDAQLEQWLARWTARIESRQDGMDVGRERMQQVNPAFIPRNHLVELALDQAERGDLDPLHELLGKVVNPYDRVSHQMDTVMVPPGHDDHYQTFCGT